MRAYIRAPVALHAVSHVPSRHVGSYAAFLVSCGACRYHTVGSIKESRYGNFVSGHGIGWNQNLVQIFRMELVASYHLLRFAVFLCCFPAFRNFYLVYMGDSGVHGGQIHVYYFLALFAVSLFNGFLHICDSVVDRDYIGQLEEGRLQHGIGSSGA